MSVWSTSQLFEDYYNVQLTEDEIAYIVLYIEAAILRNQSQVDAYLVTDRGRSQSLFATEYIKKYSRNQKRFILYEKKKLTLPEKMSFYLTMVPVDSGHCSSDFLSSFKQRSCEYSNGSFSLGNCTWINLYFFRCIQAVAGSKIDLRKSNIYKQRRSRDIFIQSTRKFRVCIAKFLSDGLEKGTKDNYLYRSSYSDSHGSMTEVFEPKVAIMVLNEPILWYEDENGGHGLFTGH